MPELIPPPMSAPEAPATSTPGQAVQSASKNEAVEEGQAGPPSTEPVLAGSKRSGEEGTEGKLVKKQKGEKVGKKKRQVALTSGDI